MYVLPVIYKIMAAIFAWGFEECGALSRETKYVFCHCCLRYSASVVVRFHLPLGTDSRPILQKICVVIIGPKFLFQIFKLYARDRELKVGLNLYLQYEPAKGTYRESRLELNTFGGN